MNTEPQNDITPLKGNRPITYYYDFQQVLISAVENANLPDKFIKRKISRKVIDFIRIGNINETTPNEVQLLVNVSILGLI